MIKAIRKAHGGGWRAGMVQPPFIRHANGTKTLARPVNPYSGGYSPINWILALFWDCGHIEGTMKRLTLNRKENRHV